jgi:hypothetical protein
MDEHAPACQPHDWHHQWQDGMHVYECRRCGAVRPAPTWDSLEPGPWFGTGPGHDVIVEVGLTLETAQQAGIPLETELQLEMTSDLAREVAAKLVAQADRADQLNREQDLPVAARDIPRR